MSEKYDNGKANAVEYNEAKQNLMKAQSDELQAKYEYLFRTKILTSIKEYRLNNFFSVFLLKILLWLRGWGRIFCIFAT